MSKNAKCHTTFFAFFDFLSFAQFQAFKTHHNHKTKVLFKHIKEV